jgi:dihydropyrimidinase
MKAGGGGRALQRPFVPDWIQKLPGGPTPPSTHGVFVPEWIRGVPDTLATRRKPILIKGAHCIIPGSGVFPFDVRLEGGIVQSIGVGLSGEGCDIVGAEGKYLIPGIVDPHTHLGLFAPFAVEAFTETRSAVLNGVTTMGVYIGGQESYLPVLDMVVGKTRESALADLFVHLPIFTKQQLDEIPLYASRYGVRSFKVYLTGIPGLIPSLDEGMVLDIMYAVAALGPDAVLNIHAENYHIVEWATEKMEAARPEGITLKEWSETHPAFSEAEAIQRSVLLAEQTGARIYIVHLSSAEGLEMVKRLRREGKQFFVETTSPYLTLSDDTSMGPLAKMTPPIRSEADRRALWEGLRADLIDTVGTDHTPMTLAEKGPTPSMWKTIPGYPAVGTHLPALIDGARRHDCPLLKLVEKMTAAPARIFGLYPRKGTILPGSDADLVIVDPMREQTVSVEGAASRADWALHEGRALIGWPVAVFKSGCPVNAEEVKRRTAPIAGTYLRRG